MTTNKVYYIQCLEANYQDKLRRNSAYSLRSFAKFLGLAPQEVSEIFRGKRNLPLKKVDYVLKKLCLSPAEELLFKDSLKCKKSRLKDIAQLTPKTRFQLSDERHYRIIAEWEYYAVITLLETKQQFASVESIASRLALPLKRAKFVVESLIEEEFIAINSNGFYQKNVNKLSTTQDIPSQAIRESHKEYLSMAREKIDSVPVADRFYSASTLAVRKDKIPAVKELIREFRDKLGQFVSDASADEIFQMNIQLFPLTELESSSSGPQETP